MKRAREGELFGEDAEVGGGSESSDAKGGSSKDEGPRPPKTTTRELNLDDVTAYAKALAAKHGFPGTLDTPGTPTLPEGGKGGVPSNLAQQEVEEGAAGGTLADVPGAPTPGGGGALPEGGKGGVRSDAGRQAVGEGAGEREGEGAGWRGVETLHPTP
ncbi:hypothetical protein T484DRAFT_1855007 [Baffinella frigidus]|nr:hypothetical protein T484DRAFT_1855007 [Cryptophyta sp. CCMP2293]